MAHNRILIFASCLVLLATAIFLWKGCKRETTIEDGGSGLLLPQIDSIKFIPLEPSSGEAFALLPRVDLSVTMPPAGDQGDQGSCTAWCLGYNLISYYEKWFGHYDYNVKEGKPDSTKVFSPSFIYNSLKASSRPIECRTGISFASAFNLIERRGVCRWSFSPYNGANDGCVFRVNDIAQRDAQNYLGYYFNRINKTENDIKNYVQSGIPVIIGIYTSKGLRKAGEEHNPGTEFVSNPAKRDRSEYHAMLVVGYDEEKKCSSYSIPGDRAGVNMDTPSLIIPGYWTEPLSAMFVKKISRTPLKRLPAAISI